MKVTKNRQLQKRRRRAFGTAVFGMNRCWKETDANGRRGAAVSRDIPSEQDHRTSNDIGNELSERMEVDIAFLTKGMLKLVMHNHIKGDRRIVRQTK